MAIAESIKAIKPSDLPAPRQAALEIMRACSCAEISTIKLSELAATDQVITAELLRIVNSPFFGFSRQITSISNAISVIGQRTLRNLALCISVRDSIRKEDLPGLDITTYWEDSLCRAISAQLIGEQVGVDTDNCFTAGLLQDFGIMVLLYLYPEHIPVWKDMQSQDPESRYQTEQSIFGTTHDVVMALLAKEWTLPDDLSKALSHHHDIQIGDLSKTQYQLSQILNCADWLCSVFNADNKHKVMEHCQKIMLEKFSMDAAKVESCLKEIPIHVESAASALGLRIEQKIDIEQILREANIKLAEDNLSYQELTWKLQNALDERDKLAKELNQELEWAREIQQSLLPKSPDNNYPIHGINIPAKQLSGDFFDFYELDNGNIYFNLADVSGKGMHAALLMAKTCSLFRCLGKDEPNPSKLLSRINKELCETSIRGMFVTMIAGLYNPNSFDLYLVNAGNLPALFFDDKNNTHTLDAKAPPLGIVDDCEFPLIKINIKNGCLYMFTDGITEGYLESGKEFGLKGLLEILHKISKQHPIEKLKNITKQLTKTSAPLRDDITMLLIEPNE